jgi:predicted alpha/beta superfamily hydrolase
MGKGIGRAFAGVVALLGMWTSLPVVAQPPTAMPAFQVERSFVQTLKSAALDRSYDVYVKLPESYDRPENARRKYPVMYLNDGPYTFQVASGVTRVPFKHELFEEFILVGLSYAVGEDPAQSRTRDLTPSVDAKRPGSGGARAYLDFMKTDVIPFVEKTWRTDPARRTLGGQSYGGLFGLWTAFNEPDLFRNYILTSASLWWDKRMMFEMERVYAAAHKDLRADIYLAIGERERPGQCGHAECIDMVADQAAMVKRMQSRRYPGLELHAQVVEGAYHETTFPVGLLSAMQGLYMPHR